MEVQGALGAGPGDGQAVQSVPGAGSPARAPAPPLPSELGLHLGRGQSHGHGPGEGDSGLQQAPEGGPAARTPCRPGRTGLGEGASQGRGLGPGGCPGAPALRRRTRAGQTGRASGRVWPVPAPQQGAALREHGPRVPRPPHSHHPLPRGPPGQRRGQSRSQGAQGRGTFLATLLDVRPRNSHCRCRVGTGYLGLAGRASGLLGRMAPDQRVHETEGWPGAGPAERERPPQLRDTMLGGAEGQGKARGRPLPRRPLPL